MAGDDKGVAQLVKRIMDGNLSAEEELVARYSRGVSRAIMANGGRPEVENLSQETFKLALEKIRHGEVREPEKLSGFIISLARNLAIGYIRRARSGREIEIEAAANSVIDPAPDQLAQLLQKEKVQFIWQAVNRMKSPRDREILSRLFLGEEDYNQIRADFGMNNLQFNLVLFRARRRFKKLYEKLTGQST